MAIRHPLRALRAKIRARRHATTSRAEKAQRRAAAQTRYREHKAHGPGSGG